MKKYQIEFSGKTRFAIGLPQKFHEEVIADSAEEAIIKLYDKYDHVFLTCPIKEMEI